MFGKLVAAATVALLFVSGCSNGGDAAPKTTPEHSGHPMAVVATVPKTVTLGATARIDVTVRNVSDRDIPGFWVGGPTLRIGYTNATETAENMAEIVSASPVEYDKETVTIGPLKKGESRHFNVTVRVPSTFPAEDSKIYWQSWPAGPFPDDIGAWLADMSYSTIKR